MDSVDHSPVVLTVAGSDSSGGAGLQADLRTFASLNCIGRSAVTCVTAQTPAEISMIEPLPAKTVASQIDGTCQDGTVVAAKTGMLYSGPIVSAAASALAECCLSSLVVDPVMKASSGPLLLQTDALDVLCAELLPLATIVTPNILEAQALCGREITSVGEQGSAAREIGERFGIACVVTGGHMHDGPRVTDMLFCNGRTASFTAPRTRDCDIHGTGCTFSAALTAFLAHGRSVEDAVGHAQEFVARAIGHAASAGSTVLNPTGM